MQTHYFSKTLINYKSKFNMYNDEYEEPNRPVKTLIGAVIILCVDLIMICFIVRGYLDHASWGIIAIAVQSIIFSIPVGGIGAALAGLLLQNKSGNTYPLISVPLLLLSVPMVIYPLTLLSVGNFVASFFEY